MQNFEKLGAFYLGRTYDIDRSESTNDLLLYDSKDLTTHAVCVGMTGSGKTGLCLSLLEEAAIDGIPAIAIDPKGDLGNLMLTFPDLEADEFRPWIDEGEATRKGMTPDQYAAATAKKWKAGLAEWGQSPSRIAKFRESVDLRLYTPGSNAGLPMTVLQSFAAPPAAVRDDAETLRERISATTSGLLALLEIDADPISSREHILISNILNAAWQTGKSLDLPRLIRAVQAPSFDRVGILDLESFFPAKDRAAFAMRINNLLASPTFSAWMEGEPLNVSRLLHTAEGKPRLSILSIAHLSESERMFFVTVLLGEILAWVRTQPGTSSLRAILYMDEVFGYLPPVANPPSKAPLLTLLKQARAYGLGLVLATQNPVDLDYKALSNAGTWFLGRLQTERDQARVLDGLQSANDQAGAEFDRSRTAEILSSLSSRVFLMNNVHDDEPAVFHTRWALSYLRGPLTREQIKTLTHDATVEPPTPVASPMPLVEKADPTSTPADEAERPVLPAGIEERFLPAERSLGEGEKLVYRPALFGRGKLHFSRSTYKVDFWRDVALVARADGNWDDSLWKESDRTDPELLDTDGRPDAAARFDTLPAEMLRAANYTAWGKLLKNHFYREEEAVVFKCKSPKVYSEPEESEADFRARLSQLAREERDLQVEKLGKKYASKFATLKRRIQSAEHAIEREKGQFKRSAFDAVISFGSSLLGALFGRKLASRTNVSRAATSARSMSRASQQKGDVARAEEKHATYKEELEALEKQFEEETDELTASFEADALEVEQLSVSPRKSDIQLAPISLLWLPWIISPAGFAEPAYALAESESN